MGKAYRIKSLAPPWQGMTYGLSWSFSPWPPMVRGKGTCMAKSGRIGDAPVPKVGGGPIKNTPLFSPGHSGQNLWAPLVRQFFQKFMDREKDGLQVRWAYRERDTPAERMNQESKQKKQCYIAVLDYSFIAMAIWSYDDMALLKFWKNGLFHQIEAALPMV